MCPLLAFCRDLAPKFYPIVSSALFSQIVSDATSTTAVYTIAG
jgi:hypothetical protein